MFLRVGAILKSSNIIKMGIKNHVVVLEVDFGSILESFGVPRLSFWSLTGVFWSIQQQIAVKIGVWASYWVIACSKQQLIASNSSKQEKIVANSTKERQVSSKKSQILVIIIIISSSSRPDQQKPRK